MNLILTLDYELFGDGSGNIFDHIIIPTYKILKICKKFGIKITLFFEVVEYWAIKKEWECGNKMGYNMNPIDAIETQICESYSLGHDIQLHFHPQWLGATYNQDKWALNFDNWRLGDFKPVGMFNTLHLFQEGKKTLKKIIQHVDSAYSPDIIRAGGYNITPSKEIIGAMKKVGFKADSSVYPGGYETGEFSKYNYRKVSLKKDYWNTNNDDLTQDSHRKDEILEIPIFSILQPRWKKYSKERLKSIFRNKKSAVRIIKGKTTKKSLMEKALFFFQKEALIWDFCLFSPTMHNLFFKYIETHLKRHRETFVLVGHPKNFTTEKTFQYLIKKAISKNYNFLTLNEYVKIISNQK